MDETIAAALQAGIAGEIAKSFDHDDSAMSEYIVVMLQNGKDATALTEELKDLIANYDASFTTWIFDQLERLKAGQSIESYSAHGAAEQTQLQDVMMDTDASVATADGEQGMGYPNARLYSGLKKTLQANDADKQHSRHRPDVDGVRSSPYGTVAVGNGAMRIPTGPRSDETPSKQNHAGPIRSKRGRGAAGRGAGRPQSGFPADLTGMPFLPGFPMPDADILANMQLMQGLIPANMSGVRPPTRRCTKWPTCFKGKACTFGHPISTCQNPHCRKTDGTCPSIHDDENIDLMSGIESQRRTEEQQEAKALAREQHKHNQSHKHFNGVQRPQSATSDGSTTTPICKFGDACTNRTCHFAHPSPASKNGSSIVLNSEFCPSAMDCKDENCSFSHPSPSNKYTPGVKLNTAQAEVNCKFNPCLNPTCRFQHAPGQKTQATFGTARNKVWTPDSAVTSKPTASTTSERKFVSDVVDEQFNAHSNVHDNDTEMEK